MSEALLSIHDLRACEDAPPTPFQVNFPDGAELHFVCILRFLPGKRISGEAIWQGKPVFAKLFVAAGAARHGGREKAGIDLLQGANIPTPALLATIPLADAFLVVTDFLPGALSLENSADTLDEARLGRAIGLLASLHAAGLVHDDLHFGNFIEHGDTMLLIDGDGVRPARSADDRRENLALFLSQLTPMQQAALPMLPATYGHPVDPELLARSVQRRRSERLRDYLRKALRNCTKFQVDRDTRHFSVVLREKAAQLLPVLGDADRLMAEGEMLKDGATCTVASVDAGTQLVIKRYNLKHWRHALSRAWRPSRAWHSWLAGYRLAFYGIATPQPLAMLEERVGPLRGRAFLVTAHCAGPDLLTVLDPDSEPSLTMQAAIRQLFGTLYELRITHGDLKGTNLLWLDEQIVLIDLDALVQHRQARAFERDWRRDRQRLLRNWPADSVLAKWLDRALPV